MYEIRRYQNCDAEDVRTVCLSTSNIRICRKKIIKNALINVFCNYYIEQEPQNCYVAADEKGQVIGYILCAINFDVWKENFRKTYLKKSNNPVTRLIGEGTIRGMQDFSKEFPAHLHIDIMPEFQGHSIGSELMEALINHLRGLKIKGLMLSVGADNSRGIHFYQKNGFQELHKGKREVLMGMRLRDNTIV